MRQVLNVNILEDRAAIKRVTLLGLPAAIAGFGVLGYLAGAVLAGDSAMSWVWIVGVIVGFAVSLPVHELVHAAFFKLFGPAGTRVIFGASKGMLYAGCPGTRYARGKMTVILLAPFVVLTCVYVLVGVVFSNPLAAAVLVLLHTSGCTGDFWFAWLIARHPEATLVEDTNTGILLLAED